MELEEMHACFVERKREREILFLLLISHGKFSLPVAEPRRKLGDMDPGIQLGGVSSFLHILKI